MQLAKDFEDYYAKEVVLPETTANDLRKKGQLNYKRVKNGLKRYNEIHKTNYRIKGKYIQGSLAMHTAVQNDMHDYDIDMALIFYSEELGEMGARAFRNVVNEALSYEATQFKYEPEVRTSCIRIKYSEGYHIDLPLFKTCPTCFGETTYIAANNWVQRNPREINNWFRNEIKNKGPVLRKVIRLSKTFCKSRKDWQMPSGLLQTILCSECLDDQHEGLDQIFYFTMKAIMYRLTNNALVLSPVDYSNLTARTIDQQRMNNWLSRLEMYLGKININETDRITALRQWGDFFQYDPWRNPSQASVSEGSSRNGYQNTEQHIENLFDVDEMYSFDIDCMVSPKGFRPIQLFDFYRRKKWLPHKYTINCSLPSNINIDYDEVYWKVLNVGAEAKKRNQIRGEIVKRGRQITEHTVFDGPHYIECYLIKNEVCIAISHVDINIRGEEHDQE